MKWFGWRSKKSINTEIMNRSDRLVSNAVTKIKAECGYSSTGYGTHGHGSGGQKSLNGIAGNGAGVMLNHRLLRSNARKAMFETPQSRALVMRFADTVADTGLRLEATPNADMIGRTMEQTEIWAEDIEQRFDMYAKNKDQNRSGQISLYQAMRQYQIYQHRDNDMFIRFYYSKERSLLNPLQFEFIDPDQIDGTAFTFSYGLISGNLRDGIIRDSKGREIGYNVWIKNSKTGQLKPKPITIPAVGSRSKRIMMLHCFTAEYAGQGRGFSPLAHALQELQKITDFSLAHIQKAITQSILALSVKPSKEAPAVNPLAGLGMDSGVAPDSSEFDSGTVASVASTGGAVEFKRVGEATFRQPGGAIVANLQAGEELVSLSNTAPSDTFDSFVNAFTSYLSSSMSMPIEVLLMKFDANYSASRASLMMFWRIVRVWQQEMDTDFLTPVYRMWLSEEIAAGRIKAPGWRDPRLRAAWLDHNWVGSPMPNIDPKRTADADRTYIELGATSLDAVARGLNGSSGKKNRAKNKKAIPELTSLPSKSGGASGNTVGSGA